MAKHKPTEEDWQLEKSIKPVTSLDDLIDAQPFKSSSDEQGESVTAGTRIPTWLHRAIVRIREMKGSPYQVNSDVIRDCIYIGLQVLQIRYGYSEDWRIESRLAKILEDSGAGIRIAGRMEEFESNLRELCRCGDYDRAASHLTKFVEYASEFDDSWLKGRVFSSLKNSAVVRDLLSRCEEPVTKVIEGQIAFKQLKEGKNASTS